MPHSSCWGIFAQYRFHAMKINNTGGQLSSDTRFQRVKTFNDVRARSYVEILFKENLPWSKVENGGGHHTSFRNKAYGRPCV